ncbi:MAG: YCF48-related protein [Syntrophales bacterium]|nr:YCF48-related protein [Syntrophales bacterium]
MCNIQKWKLIVLTAVLVGGLLGSCRAPAWAGAASTAVGWVVGASNSGYGLILHTTDGGAHWVRQGSSEETPDVSLNGVCAIDRNNAWAVGINTGGYGTILRTTDGGAHWVRQGDPKQIPDLELSHVYALNRDCAWVVGYDGLILHTADGGRTWVRQGEGLVTSPAGLQGVYARDPLHIWAVGSPLPNGSCGVILRSTDGGASWQRQTYTPRQDIRAPYLISVHGSSPHTVWVVGSGTVMRSTNDGETWEDLTPGSSILDYNDIFALDASTVWLVRDQGGIFKFDGSQWQQQPSYQDGYYLLGISALDGETAWTVGTRSVPEDPPGIILFKEKGQDWTVQPFAPNANLYDVSFVPQNRGRALPAIYQLLFGAGPP